MAGGRPWLLRIDFIKKMSENKVVLNAAEAVNSVVNPPDEMIDG